MNPIAVILLVLSGLMHAVRNFYTKKSNDKQVFVWWYELVGVLFFLPIFLFYFFREGMGSWWGIMIGAISGIVHGSYWLSHAKALEHGDLSHVYPIMRAAPLLVVPFAWILLGERVSFIGFSGIMLMVLGVYAVNLKSMALKTFFEPIKSITRERATRWALVTLLLVTTYSLIDKKGVGLVHPLVFTYYFTLMGFVFFSLYIFAKKRKWLMREGRENKKTILLNGILGISGYAFSLVALSMAQVSYVIGLRQTSVLFAVLMGGHLLNEKHRLIRTTAAVLMVAGAFLISVA